MLKAGKHVHTTLYYDLSTNLLPVPRAVPHALHPRPDPQHRQTTPVRTRRARAVARGAHTALVRRDVQKAPRELTRGAEPADRLVLGRLRHRRGHGGPDEARARTRPAARPHRRGPLPPRDARGVDPRRAAQSHLAHALPRYGRLGGLGAHREARADGRV